VARFIYELLLKCRGNSVFEPFCLIVDLIPFHPEHLRQHTLNEVVAQDSPFRNLASLRRELDVPIRLDRNKAIFFQTFESKRHCCSRH